MQLYLATLVLVSVRAFLGMAQDAAARANDGPGRSLVADESEADRRHDPSGSGAALPPKTLGQDRRFLDAIACYAPYSPGKNYQPGDYVSADVTESKTETVQCTPGASGCSSGGTKVVTRDVQVRSNYRCNSPFFCGNVGFAPGGVNSGLSWTTDGGECTITSTLATVVPPAAWSGGGCPDAYTLGTAYAPDAVVSVATHNGHFLVYQCTSDAASAAWCGMEGYQPADSAYYHQVWTALGSCDGTIAPSAAAVADVGEGYLGGCPGEWEQRSTDDPYIEGDRVSKDGVVYQCKAWPYNLNAGQVGFEPMAENAIGNPNAWMEAWTVEGACSGTIAPTKSPSFESLDDIGGCPVEYTPGFPNYKAGDRVSVAAAGGNEKLLYACRPWPEGDRCNTAGFEPGSRYSDMAWDLVGFCSGTLSPTESPTPYANYEIIGADGLTGKWPCQYSRCRDENIEVPCTEGSTGCGTNCGSSCTKTAKSRVCMTLPVDTYATSQDYEEGDVVRVGTQRYQCRGWPWSLFCSKTTTTFITTVTVTQTLSLSDFELPNNPDQKAAVVSSLEETIKRIVEEGLSDGDEVSDVTIISIGGEAIGTNGRLLESTDDIVYTVSVLRDTVVVDIRDGTGTALQLNVQTDGNGDAGDTIAADIAAQVTGIIEEAISNPPEGSTANTFMETLEEVATLISDEIGDVIEGVNVESVSTDAVASEQSDPVTTTSGISRPSSQPSHSPSLSAEPSMQPSSQPSSLPSSQPSFQPSSQPSRMPSEQPSSMPSESPSASAHPSSIPSQLPSISSSPSSLPSENPSVSHWPTSQPSSQPSLHPSEKPSISSSPSEKPSMNPSVSDWPTSQPSESPSISIRPTNSPSKNPTASPSKIPTRSPTTSPTKNPTIAPSKSPSSSPTTSPTKNPTASPSRSPSASPTTTASPSKSPTTSPTSSPTRDMLLLQTGFEGRQVVKKYVASNIVWTTNRVRAPAELTAKNGAFIPRSPTIALFDTNAAQDAFTVNRNIEKEGSWFVDIPLTPGNNIRLDRVRTAFRTYKDDGTYQTIGYTVIVRAEVLRGGDGKRISFSEVSRVTYHSGSVNLFDNDLWSASLSRGESYRLRLTVSSPRSSTMGNNVGFIALRLDGRIEGGQIETLLLTGFKGRTISGSTASNIAWTTNRLGAPTTLTAKDGDRIPNYPEIALFDTQHARNAFAVNRNVGTEGQWFVDIPLTTDEDFQLDRVDIVVGSFYNSGFRSGNDRRIDVTAEVFRDSNGSPVGSPSSISHTVPGAGTKTYSLDLSSVNLLSDANYLMRLTVFSSSRSGNNAGFFSLKLLAAKYLTNAPTESPTQSPTERPSLSLQPTTSISPSRPPTNRPTKNPTASPSKSPTTNPSSSPTRDMLLLQTGFTGRQILGNTASNIVWTANRMRTPVELTAENGAFIPISPTIALFKTNAARNAFAVDRNIGKEGAWFVDIPLTPGNNIQLNQVMTQVDTYENTGSFKANQRRVNITAEVLRDGDGERIGNPTTVSKEVPGGLGTTTFFANKLSSVRLSSGASYRLRLTVSSPGTKGNNVGFITLRLDGRIEGGSLVTLLSTDFTGRTISGSTASNIAWTTNRLGAKTRLTAVDAYPKIALFNTAAAQDAFAVNRNVGTEGQWFVDIPLTPVEGVQLDRVDIVVGAYRDDGAREATASHFIDVTAEVFRDSNGSPVGSPSSISHTVPGGGTQTYSLDLSTVNLLSDANYLLRLTVSGPAGSGNNAGLFSLNLLAAEYLTKAPTESPTVSPTRDPLLLQTGFTGRVVSGSTASNIAWTANQLGVPGVLTARDYGKSFSSRILPIKLFNTPAAQNVFAVDRNLGTEGSWAVDITLSPSYDVQLDKIDLEVGLYKNSGARHTIAGEIVVKAEIRQGGELVGNPPSASHTVPGSSATKSYSLDLSTVNLSGGVKYLLRLIVSGTRDRGNNAGIFSLNLLAAV